MRGVRVHNLQSIDVEIPRNKMTVITGVSGSGKSSLAFDTLYAEGRRRYVECLSTYTQQFLDRMARPDLDSVDGLPPAIAIDRAVPASQARSTVGTTTEIHDYLRLLYARVGRPRCVDCDREVTEESASDVARTVIREGGRGIVTFEADAPGSIKDWKNLLGELERDGFVRVVQGGRVVPLGEASHENAPLEVAVDRVTFTAAKRTRIAEAVETAYRFGHDRCVVRGDDGSARRFSRRLHCAECDREYSRPEPNLFSPNSPLGACPVCQGFGRSVQPDMDRIIPDPGLTLAEGAIDPWNKPSHAANYNDLRRAGRKTGLPWNVAYRDLAAKHRRLIEQGGGGFHGIDGFFRWLERRTYKVHIRVFLARYRAYLPCDGCAGRKLRPEALAVKIRGTGIGSITAMPIDELCAWVDGLRMNAREKAIATPIVHELKRRLGYLVEVGLGYLTLERPSRTLSGGEAQRIQLARSVGSSLVDTLYVLDEPSVGLHPLDVERLIVVLRRLRDLGNTLVVVEHDPRIIREADWIIDLGPGAGTEGGRVLYQGSVKGLRTAKESVIGDYLARRPVGSRTSGGPERGDGNEPDWIELHGASVNNLRDLSVRFPRRALTVVTGVSGSGKSSLIHDTLHGALAAATGARKIETGPHRALVGVEGIAAVELVDQSPIGRTPRSNPVTYVKAFDGIRRKLAATAQARSHGLKPGYFSFNVPGGRCDVCEGAGSVIVEMHFLPDVVVPCDGCAGTRYSASARGFTYRGRNVSRILQMTVREALEFFHDVPDVSKRLQVLDDVGLGYLRLGQPAPTLSGGEAQRLKLAAHLGPRAAGSNVFLLDEPTTGLHLKDVAVLVRLLQRLVDTGHTIVVVEHHLDLIHAADWVIDLGPGPGDKGGQLVAEGPPEVVARSKGATGRHLAERLRWS